MMEDHENVAGGIPGGQSDRRQFIKTSVTSAAIGALAVPRSVHAGVNETLRVGLIGCGGRGRGAAIDALSADPDAQLVAVADTFRDQVDLALAELQGTESIRRRVAVTSDQIHVGFDGYRQLIDSDVDVVLLATPPHFRPAHLAYAVEKGKHCFVEKPVAVDVPGVTSVRQTCELARQKKLAIVSGLVFRADPGIAETVKRIQDGAIGEIVAIQACRNGGALWHRGDDPKWSRMEYQVRNWLYYTWLSGDHIVEQAVHSLDKVNWLLDDVSPASAFGMGGRQQRTGKEWGHIYDHHTVFYDYPNGVKCFFTCRQQNNTMMLADEIVLGAKGQARLTAKRIDGESPWRYRTRPLNMFRLEHEGLFNGIRHGVPLNHGHYMCNSTLTAIMGRMCTYTGQMHTWENVLANTERLGPTSYEWGNIPEPAVPVPGMLPL